MRVRNKKILSLLLVSSIVITNLSATSSYALDKTNVTNIESTDTVSNIKIIETDNGFIMEYEQVENGENVYYYEECKDNIVYTKKYVKDNGDKKLTEELTTTFTREINDGKTIMVAIVNNITKNTTFTETVMETTSEDEITTEKARRPHPTDSTYSFNHGSAGHLGFRNLTHAAITGAVAGVINGGKLVSGSIAGIATLVLNGGYKNLYYKEETFYPYGPSKGKPLWKKVVKHYYDKNRTKQCGNTLYYNSTTLCKN